MKASLRTRWLQRLRDPQTKQTTKAYFRDSSGKALSLSYIKSILDDVVVEELPTICCALGHYHIANKTTEQYDLHRISNHVLIMNDYEGKSLLEIADWIEANVPVEEG